MQELLIINPSPRPGKRKGKPKMAKRRSAAQKRATAKLVSFNRARRAGSSRKRTSVKRRRRTAVASYKANPSPVKRRRSRVARARNRMRSYRRNPIANTSRGIVPMLKDSALGAVGAVAVTSIHSFIPMPDAFKTGNMMYVSKAVLAVAFSILAGKVMSKSTANKMASGSLTVTMYEALKDNVGGMIPGLNGLGYYPGGRVVSNYPRMNGRPAPALSEYVNQGMGEYVNRGMSGITQEDSCNSIY